MTDKKTIVYIIIGWCSYNNIYIYIYNVYKEGAERNGITIYNTLPRLHWRVVYIYYTVRSSHFDKLSEF